MNRIKTVMIFLGIVLLAACNRDRPNTNPGYLFEHDMNYRIGKWYSVSDVGITLPTYNARLDTIWFLSDSLAGWTGFKSNPHEYSFWKTYLSGRIVKDKITYLAPNVYDSTKTDTVEHSFGFTGDTMIIFWQDFPTMQSEYYLKKKN